MKTAARRWASTRPLSSEDEVILRWLLHHRLMTAKQLQRGALPHRVYQTAARRLNNPRKGSGLQAAGLVDHFTLPGPRRRYAWYLTPQGVAVAQQNEAAGSWAGRQSGPPALAAHTLTVNEVGLAFLTAARERGHECWWAHEQPAVPGRRGNVLGTVADAKLGVQGVAGNEITHRWVEVDRNTKSAMELAEQLQAYAVCKAEVERPGEFPGVLVVLEGGSRQTLKARLTRVLAICRTDGRLEEAKVDVSFVRMVDLQQGGPYGKVFVRLEKPEVLVDWLGEGAAGSMSARASRSA